MLSCSLGSCVVVLCLSACVHMTFCDYAGVFLEHSPEIRAHKTESIPHRQSLQGQDKHSRCRDYCIATINDCPSGVFEYSSYRECVSMCETELHDQIGSSDAIFGNSIECRANQVRLAYNTKQEQRHCAHARIDAGVDASGGCPRGCPCTEACAASFDSSCIFGTSRTENQCDSFVLEVMSHLHGTGVGMLELHPEESDAWNTFGESAFGGGRDACPAFRQWSLQGCFCQAESSEWLKQHFGERAAALASSVATGLITSVCGIDDHFAQCPQRLPAPAHGRIDVARCMSAVPSTTICGFQSKSQSCCAAVRFLDSLGCFCESAFTALQGLSPALLALRDNFRDACVPVPAQFGNTAGCPALEYDVSGCERAPWNRTLGSVLLRQRLETIGLFGAFLNKHKNSFNYDAVGADYKTIMHPEIVIHVMGVGTYRGIDSVLEYLSLAFVGGPNRHLWDGYYTLPFDWRVEGNVVGSRIYSHNEWFEQTLNQTMLHTVEYEFDECSELIRQMRIEPDPSTFPHTHNAVGLDPWSPEQYCATILDFCVGDLQEFQTIEHCVRFQRSLPKDSCRGRAGRELEGNSSSCKLKHSFMLPLRPQHHCHHASTGHFPDDNGDFVCVPQDCDVPTHPLTVMSPADQRFEGAQDTSICDLTVDSELLLHLAILADSPCQLQQPVIAEILRTPPTNHSAHRLSAMCRPKPADLAEAAEEHDSGDFAECEIMRYNLQIALDTFRHVCPEARPSAASTLASQKAMLRLAYDYTAFHRLVCLAFDGDAEAYLCGACQPEELPRVARWTRISERRVLEDDGGVAAAPTKLCRQAVHFACSSLHAGRAPRFCDVCFQSVDKHAGVEGDGAACLAALEEYWRQSCVADASSPLWYELDPEPFESTYPGNEPASDTTDHDLDSDKVFDYIVVGAGSAGCIIARRLSDAGHSVLVLEEGVDWQKDEGLWELTRQRRASVHFMTQTPLVRRFQSMPNPGLLDRPTEIVVGSTLGGTSTINGGLYSRPGQEEFDEHWPEGWKGDDVLPFFKKFESFKAPTDHPENHGLDGPITVTRGSPQSYGEEFAKAAERAGVPLIVDGASGAKGKTGMYRMSTTFNESGHRQDAFSTYLLPILPRKGLEVRSGARVAELKYEREDDTGQQVATGAVYILHGLARVSVYAMREVILCAGYLGSPKVLLLSGIGPRQQLEDFEIDVGHELPGVGQQLSARPFVPMIFGGQLAAPEHTPALFTSEEVKREWHTQASPAGLLDTPNVALYGKGSSALNGSQGVSDYLMSFSNLNGEAQPLQTLASLCKVCRPHSKGHVELRSRDPADDLSVHSELLSDERDVEILIACMRRHLQVYRHFRFRGLDLLGLFEMSDDQLRENIRALASNSWHAFSTCRMGDGPLDVVSPKDLKVHGFANLRVVDASVIPEAPCSGPLATTYMLAERGASLLLEQLTDQVYPGKHVLHHNASAVGLGAGLVFLLGAIACALLVNTLLRCRIIRKDFKDHQQETPTESAERAGTDTTTEAVPVEEEEEGLTTMVSAQGRPRGGLGRKRSSVSSVMSFQRQGSSVRRFSEWVADGSFTARSSAPAAPRTPIARIASALAGVGEGSDEGGLDSSSIFDRKFRRQSLMDAFTTANILADAYLSIYFADIRCKPRPAGGWKLRRKKLEVAPIISGVSGQIESGKLTILMGSSGCGKTTLLHQLAQRSTGVEVEGQLLYKLATGEGFRGTSPAHKRVRNFMQRNIAFLHQEANDLPPQLSVYEVMVYYFTLMVSPQLVSSTEGIKSIYDTLEFIGLAQHAHKQVFQLSGGQKRRLQIGVRLLDCPMALFLDEPDAGLDGTTSLKIMMLLQQITEHYGLTIVCSLHRPRVEVMELCHSIYLMHSGAGIFQGSYEQLRSVLRGMRRSDYTDSQCPVDYFLDYAGIDQQFLQQVYAQHIEQVNEVIIPQLQELAEAQDPNDSVPPKRLERGSLLLCATTLFSAFTLLVGVPRRWGETFRDIGHKYAPGFTLMATALMFQFFLNPFLPVTSTSDIAVLHGALLIWGSVTLTIFQVCVAEGLVEVESRLFFQLMQEALVAPFHVVVFWAARSFLIVCSCLAGFALFYVGLGWQPAHALESGLVWFLFTLQNCMGAHFFQVAFGKALSPVLYGLWSAVQILFCGVTVPLQEIPSTWRWIQDLNPQYYCFSTIMSLEIAVGRYNECGEYCDELLDGIFFDEVNVLTTVGVLMAFFFAWSLLLYLAMKSISSHSRNSGSIARMDRAAYGAQPLPATLLAHLRPQAAEVSVRSLLKARRSVLAAPVLASDSAAAATTTRAAAAHAGPGKAENEGRRLGLLAPRPSSVGARGAGRTASAGRPQANASGVRAARVAGRGKGPGAKPPAAPSSRLKGAGDASRQKLQGTGRSGARAGEGQGGVVNVGGGAEAGTMEGPPQEGGLTVPFEEMRHHPLAIATPTNQSTGGRTPANQSVSGRTGETAPGGAGTKSAGSWLLKSRR